MKHLFHIHSNTCYITSLGVIETENLNYDDVIFLICRNLPVMEEKIRHIRINDDLYYFPYLRNNQLYTFAFLKSRSRIKEVDLIVDSELNEDFIYYVHNSRNYLYRIIITKQNCREVRFIEDGLDMYLEKAPFDRKYPQKIWLRHRIVNNVLGRILRVYFRLNQINNPFANKGTENQKIYGLTKYSFQKFLDPSYDFKVVNLDSLKNLQDYYLPDDTNVFVFSALVEQNVVKQESILNLLDWFVPKFKIEELHINFHPHQSSVTRNEIQDKLESLGVRVTLIPDEEIMEILFLNNENLRVFGTGTSLLIYAAYFSNTSTVYSLYTFFKKNLKIDTIRTVFWDNTFYNINKENFKLYTRDFD